jgi:hypothetical protein
MKTRHKVSAGGSFRVDKVFAAPVGRLAIASGASTLAGLRNVEACLQRLSERGRLDVLLALKQQRVAIAQVLDADRADTLDALLASLTPSSESAPVWPAVQTFLGPKGGRSLTVRRYGVSLLKLERFGVLAPDAAVSALGAVDWKALGQRWQGPGCSGSDWNQMRRAVSHFLTVQLGDVYHPLRRSIVKAIPKRKEVERIPDLDAPTFWQVVAAAPEHVRAAYVALVALGLRTGEYLKLRETDLHPITKTVSIGNSKSAPTVLRVDPELWPWVVAAVPAPLAYCWLRLHWKRALKAVGADPTLRLHDLRHLTAQLLVNAGQTEASVQSTMRHETASMTRRYARQKDRGENAAALAKALLPARSA